jgi:hypothetical protein
MFLQVRALIFGKLLLPGKAWTRQRCSYALSYLLVGAVQVSACVSRKQSDLTPNQRFLPFCLLTVVPKHGLRPARVSCGSHHGSQRTYPGLAGATGCMGLQPNPRCR